MDSSVPVKNRPGIMIGAWGFKFFESDHDYDIASHLAADMGLSKYSQKTKMQESLLNPKDIDFVTKHVQKPTELDRVFNKYHSMLQDHKVINIKGTIDEGIMIDSPRYYIFLLGLLAMRLGCTLSRKHRRWMKANCNSCLFMYERLDQAKMAAFGYQNGKPLKLGSKTLPEMIATSDNARINVPNNAIFVTFMRMHLDNEIAKGKGATATKGVDISNVFAANAADMAAMEEEAAIKKVDVVEQENTDPPKNTGWKMSQWASNQAGWDRLAQFDYGEVQPPRASTEKAIKLITEHLKNAGLP